MSKPNFELLREAYAILGGIPEANFNLNSVVYKKGPALDCGTIACGAGWLAMHPKFQALGLQLKKHRSYTDVYYVNFKNNSTVTGPHHFHTPMAKVFNITEGEARTLFNSHYGVGNDKAVLLSRIKNFLRQHGKTTKQLRAAEAMQKATS